MSIATLLHMNNAPTSKATFSFEHMMAHRNYFGIMSPLDRFSVLPYLLDPMGKVSPADNWHLNHQQAHNDALTTIPTFFYGRGGLTPEEQVQAGLAIGQNIRDPDLNVYEAHSWWTFKNHMEHYVANGSVLPIAGPNWMWPFW